MLTRKRIQRSNLKVKGTRTVTKRISKSETRVLYHKSRNNLLVLCRWTRDSYRTKAIKEFELCGSLSTCPFNPLDAGNNIIRKLSKTFLPMLSCLSSETEYRAKYIFSLLLGRKWPSIDSLSLNEAILHDVRMKLLCHLRLRWIYREQLAVGRTRSGVDTLTFFLLF